MPFPNQGAAVTDQERLTQINPTLGRGFRPPAALVLLTVVLVVGLVPLVFYGRLVTNEMTDALVASAQERQLRLAEAAAMRLDAFVDQSGREAAKIGEALASLPAIDAPRLGAFLDDATAAVRFVPVGGAPLAAAWPDADLGALRGPLDQDARAAADQSVAPAAGAPRPVLMAGPFALERPRGLAVIVSCPVQRGGRVVGVYQQVALIEKTWAEATAAVPEPMRIFLLRGDGAVVSAPRGLAARADAFGRREVVQQFLASRGRSRGSRSYEGAGPDGAPRPMLGSFAATAHGWGVFVEVDQNLALAPVARLTRLATYGAALAAALALGAALLLGGMISRPIQRLAAISNRLAEGEFEERAPGSRVAELDVLASNFNRMAARLGELVERFRVAARDANDMFLGTIRALAEAIDEKDPYTKGHSVRVNRCAVIIGRYLGLSREEMRHLQISSLLHDVGKIGIDDAILKKPAALSEDEFAVMKTHPERGAKIMGRIPQMRNIIPGMRFHHERFAGGGYPTGLKGGEIPLQARIIAVADTFDAMTTDRPYQRALPVREAVARINDMKGRILDPGCVEAFNRAYEAGEFEDFGRRLPADAAPRADAPDAVAGERRGN